jgi:hypothetical protein
MNAFQQNPLSWAGTDRAARAENWRREDSNLDMVNWNRMLSAGRAGSANSPQPASPELRENVPETPANGGPLRIGSLSLGSGFGHFRPGIADGLRPKVEIFPFSGEATGDRVRTTLGVREEPQNLFLLKFVSNSKRSNFEDRTESVRSRASERNGPFGE